MSLGTVIFISVCVVFVVLLFSGVMFRFALYYRDQVKKLKEQVKGQEFRIEVLKEERNVTKKIIDECGEDIKKYEKEIKALKQKIDEYEEAFKRKNEVIDAIKTESQSRDKEIERLTQELKQRGESVKEKPHKNKKKNK
ncbi:hypothetical protein [Bartonella sp. AD24XZML]|uniref:hypothetical protein n=1 Tax=Bartonella sp. AD24XZML TaxID=3243463 RepID=UPI0035CFA052